MAKLLAWLFLVALLLTYLTGGDFDRGDAISLLVLISVLTIAEAIESIGRK